MPFTDPNLMTPASSRPVVLVTGAARRLGREIALALAAGGWQVAVHYRSSEADAIKTVADCARLAGGMRPLLMPIWSDEAAVRGLLPRVIAHFGRVDAVVNSASTFEHDTRRQLRLCRAGKAPAQQHRRAPSCWRRRCTRMSRPRAGQPRARSSTCWTRSSGTRTPIFSATRCPRPRWKRPAPCWPWRWRPQVRVVGVAPGPDADQPPADATRSSRRATSSRRWAARPRRPTWPPP